jgi:integrase
LGSFSSEPVPIPVPLHKRRSLTLAEAREKARIGREIAKSGLSPSKYWNEDEGTHRHTFEEAARARHKEISQGWRNPKHAEQWIRTLEAYAFPAFGKVPVDEIEAADIQKVLLPIWLSKGETARRLKQRIAVVLDYSHAQGWRPAEAPMRAVNQLMGGIKQAKKKNFAAMPYVQLPAFFAALRSGEFSVGRSALMFLILTAARSGEVRGATWAEIDIEAGEWRLPADRMKAGKPHIVPLVPAAIKILVGMRGVFSHHENDLLFPGSKGQMSDATLAKVLRTHGGGLFTIHGFRSSFRDWVADSGFADAWGEAALAHGNPDKTEAAYRRTTFFSPRKETLMPRWADYVLGVSNVVSIRKELA